MESRYHHPSDDDLHLVALKYKTRGEFQKGNPNEYVCARRRKILEQICEHMENVYLYRTNKELAQLALTSKTRVEFQKINPAAYRVAQKRRILDQIFSHMPRISTISSPEQELGDIIRTVYPKTLTLRIRRKGEDLLPNKPWIGGFDIDHYVPELKKGVEFDGTFWHSPEGLRRSRSDWPEEDLLNYHEIKDKYFLETHGVQILHIKEADWIKDKETCLDRIFEFLGQK
jgi:hypothetical protein